MKKQITSISLVQTAKVAAALYFVIGIIAAVFLLIAAIFGGRFSGIFMALLVPFLYAAIGFVVVIVAAWIYNQVAKFVGGIEFTLTDVPGEF